MLIAIRNLVFGCFSVCLLLGCGASSDDSPASVEKSGPPPVSSVEEESDPAKMTAATLLRKLKDANPDYNNNAQAVDGPDGYVAQVALMESGITDITPLRGTQLTTLDLGGVPVTDISPLEGMPLQTLLLDEAQVEDLSPLKGMPLSVLRMNNCPVSDISALKAMPLTQLNQIGRASCRERV